MVPFSLETRPQYDTSDGYVLTWSVPGPNGGNYWTVIAASTMRFDTDMSYLADKLTVTYSTTTGGTTSITAHNQADSSSSSPKSRNFPS